MKKLTQDQAVFIWLKENVTINPTQALNELGVFRLAACICRLRKLGHAISCKRISKQGRFRKVSFAEYHLDRGVNL